MKKLIDYDPLTKTSVFHEYDHASKKMFIETVQDTSAYIEKNKRLANDPEYKRKGIKNDLYHYASVPNSVLLEWKTKYGLDPFVEDDLPKIDKLLQSNEYRHLRTVDRL